MSNCNCHTEIIRDGSGQLTRFLKALDPKYAPIDGRNIEELLVFAKRYASQVRFFDIPESKMAAIDPTKVNWREFFRRDMAVIAASISVVDTNQVKKDYTELRNSLETNPDADSFGKLFKPVIGMAARIDAWYSIAIPENPLYTDLDLAISSNLKTQLHKTRAYEKGFSQAVPGKSLNLDYAAIINDELWEINKPVNADISIFKGDNEDDKIRYAALYADDVFTAFHGFLEQLVENAEGYLHYALTQYPSHQPHMALFIAFLQLFKLAQDQLNGLTEKMLNFYYRDVLRLTEKPSIPDRAYVVFELAKDVATYPLAAGTSLKAGKDASGKEQLYKTESELVINQAKVKELKTIFIDKDDGASPVIKGIYARPVANSLDGFGKPFPDPYGKWPTFGKGGLHLPKSRNICQAVDQVEEMDNRKDATRIGFALASPQLVLQGGRRIIAWTFSDFKRLFDKYDISKGGIQILLTGKKGWINIDTSLNDKEGKLVRDALDRRTYDKATLNNSGYFIAGDQLLIYLPVSEEGIVPFNSKLHPGIAYTTPYPVMQMMIGPELGIDSITYKDLKFDGQTMEVLVGSINPYNDADDPNVDGAATNAEKINLDGLKLLKLKNNDGLIETGKPFDPFTAYPAPGSSLYIGSDEIFNKQLGELAVNIQFMTSAEEGRTSKQQLIRASVLQKREFKSLSRKSKVNFTSNTLTQNILFDPEPVKLERAPLTYNDDYTAESYKGFIQLENASSSKEFLGRTDNFFEQLQRLAVTIKIKDISVSYYSVLANVDPAIDQFFHVYPFGFVETYFGAAPARDLVRSSLTSKKLQTLKKPVLFAENAFDELDKAKDYLLVDAKNKLLPQFTYTEARPDSSANAEAVRFYKTLLDGVSKIDWKAKIVPKMLQASGLTRKITGDVNQYFGEKQEEGMLFIGLENLYPLQTVSLLFHFAEGSAEDEDNDPPPIHWSYLAKNEWKPLNDENIVSDSTYGFQTTGIVKIDIPSDASNDNTIISDNLVWLCASVDKLTNCIPMLVDVVAQAVPAKFEDHDNAPSHFDNALPAGSITKLLTGVAEVSSVKQPFASFDGKRKEIDKEFYTRVSERLRHKSRAVTAWDYEHLVLDRFSSIYKVKCITHTDPNCLCRHSLTDPDECCGPQLGPGHVLIVPIANLKNRNAANPLKPKTSRLTLLSIQDYLKKRTSPFVHVHARNPVYEEVLVSFQVKFHQGTDKGYYLKKLNEDIVHYLTPWAFDENAEVKFGQKIYASSIINFIEEQPYVDFIVDFLMFVCRDTCCGEEEETKQDGSAQPQQPKPLDEVVVVAVATPWFREKDAAVKAFRKRCGCDDVEYFLGAESTFTGEVVAKPSTGRSILVSAPQHEITLYDPPTETTPCEKRAKQNRANPVPPVKTGKKPTLTIKGGSQKFPKPDK